MLLPERLGLLGAGHRLGGGSGPIPSQGEGRIEPRKVFWWSWSETTKIYVEVKDEAARVSVP